MAHIYTGCSDLGRLLLRSERDGRRDAAIIGTVSWLIALSNHFKLNYEHSIVRQFPSVCHYCLERPCACDRTNKRARHRSGQLLSEAEVQEKLVDKVRSIRNANVEIDFIWLIDQISAIYPSNRALLAKGGQAFVVGKLLEEGGELHRAYSNYLRGTGTKLEIEDELADLTAWLISCWDLDGTGKSFDAEFASAYAGGCRKCKSTPCVCPSYSITMGQEEIIREIAKTLRSLPDTEAMKGQVEAAISEVEETSATPTPANKKSLLKKVQGVIKGLRSVKEVSGDLSETTDHLSDLVDNLQDWI
jgi:NTP pyrophosphatase (non-canonical NTP hydrolase)